MREDDDFLLGCLAGLSCSYLRAYNKQGLISGTTAFLVRAAQMEYYFTSGVKALAISAFGMIIAVIVAFVIEGASPTVFTVGGPYPEFAAPVPGTIYSEQEVMRGAGEARARMKQLEKLLPPQKPTFTSIMRIALTSQFWILALAFIAVTSWLHAAPWMSVAISTLPFAALVIPGWLTAGQGFFFPLAVAVLLFIRSRRSRAQTA